MKVRYQADADLNEDIVSGVLRRIPEIDFQMADELELASLPDPEVLTLAAQDGRILVTHDRRTLRIFIPLVAAKPMNASPRIF